MPLEDEPSYEVTKDSVLYVIDGSVSMVHTRALAVALNAVSDSVRDIAAKGTSHNDAGVILYNVTKKESKSKAHVILSLSEPKVSSLKELMRLSGTNQYFSSKFTSITTSDEQKSSDGLISALRLANSELNQLHTRSSRRVVIITNDDNPAQGNSDDTGVIANLMGDVTGSPAYCMPIFLNSEEKKFDIHKFWINLNFMPPPIASMHPTSGNEDEFFSHKLPDPIDMTALQNSNENLVISKSRRKHISFRGKMELGNLKIGIRGYNIVRARPRLSSYNIVHVTDKQGNQSRALLNSVRTLAFASSGSEVSEDVGITKKFKLSSSVKDQDWSVPVNDDQFEWLHNIRIGDSSVKSDHYVLKLNQFYPVDAFVIPEVIGHSIFIAPGNDLVSSSWKSFACLHRSMNRKRKIALATLIPARGRRSSPELGFLFAFDPASKSHINDKGECTPRTPSPNTTAGMYFVPLPFADDEREKPQLPNLQIPNPSDTLITEAGNLIRKFNMPSGFNPNRFPHPSHGLFTKLLEHHALSLSLGDDSFQQPDPSRPRYNKINKACARITESLKSHLLVYESSSSNQNDIKLELDDPNAKRQKVSNDSKPSNEALIQAYKVDKLHKFKVVELKWAISPFAKPHQKKDDLVQQVKNLIDSGKITLEFA